MKKMRSILFMNLFVMGLIKLITKVGIGAGAAELIKGKVEKSIM